MKVSLKGELIIEDGDNLSGDVVIPDGVKSIGAGAFAGCTSLKR